MNKNGDLNIIPATDVAIKVLFLEFIILSKDFSNLNRGYKEYSKNIDNFDLILESMFIKKQKMYYKLDEMIKQRDSDLTTFSQKHTLSQRVQNEVNNKKQNIKKLLFTLVIS